jgi:hypothetical protein
MQSRIRKTWKFVIDCSRIEVLVRHARLHLWRLSHSGVLIRRALTGQIFTRFISSALSKINPLSMVCAMLFLDLAIENFEFS